MLKLELENDSDKFALLYMMSYSLEFGIQGFYNVQPNFQTLYLKLELFNDNCYLVFVRF